MVKRELLKKIERRKKLENIKKIKEFEEKKEKRLKLSKFVKVPRLKINLNRSNTLNKIYDFFMFNFSFLYLPIFEFLVNLNIEIKKARLLALIYTLIALFLTYIVAILVSLFLLYYFRVITNVDLLIKILKLSFFLGFILVALSIFYPYYSIKQKAEEIDNLLPFVLVHMNAIAVSGVNFYTVLKMIAETKEYKSVAEEFDKIVLLVDYGGLNLFDAMNLVAEQTPSEKLKEILKSITYIIKSGGDLERYLQQKSEEAIMNLKINKEKYIGFLDVFSDLYVIMVVAIPILFISIVAVLGSFSPSEKLYKFAKFMTFVIIPLIDIGFLIMLNLHKNE